MKPKSNVILGAGPSGLFCAHELANQGQSSLLLEKASFVGGLAATHKLDDAKFEVGPHIFHTDDKYVMNIARDYLGDQLEYKEWSVTQYIQGQLFIFPNAIFDMWRQLGSMKMIQFILSFIKYKWSRPRDFKSFVYQKVGKQMAEFNVINYTEKMWGVPLEELEIEWIKPRFDRLSFWKIIKTAFSNHKRSFYFPKGGAGVLYEKMSINRDIRLKEPPSSIIHADHSIIEVKTNSEVYAIDQLYSSIPLLEFLNILNPPPPEDVAAAARSLRYRSQVYVVLVIDELQSIDYQWIYFSDHKIPFCRVHSPGAFSDSMTPEGKAVLVFEYFCFEANPIWNLKDVEIINKTILEFNKLNIVTPLTVLNSKVIKKKYAYPLMSKDKQGNLNVINDYLNKFNNLHMMGRHGLHTYDNQHDAARTGIDAAINSLK